MTESKTTKKPNLKLLAKKLASNVNNLNYNYQRAIKDIEEALQAERDGLDEQN